MIIVCLILFFLLCIIFTKFYVPEPFVNSKLVTEFETEYPRRVVLSVEEFLKHMIPHHQVAVDMCKILLKHTKSDFLTYLSYRMIRTQEAEIILLNDLLQSPFIN